jgi:fumarate reductase subunit C
MGQRWKIPIFILKVIKIKYLFTYGKKYYIHCPKVANSNFTTHRCKNRTLIAYKWKIGAAQKKLITTFHTHLLKI